MNMFAAFLGGAVVSGTAAFLLYAINKRKLKKRVHALTEYLEAVNCGIDNVLSRCEDNLSLLEDEICKTVGELRIAKEYAQSLQRKQADNLADIAHQLKTPITSMALMTELLSDEDYSGRQECLYRLNAQIERMEYLTESLLTMARLDSGAVRFEPMPVQFAELVARSIEPVEHMIQIRNQQLVVINGECILMCDPVWTSEALLNIIKNCSEHTPEGGHIRAECAVTPLYTQIAVEDDGIGFRNEDIAKLFNRFYRGADASPDSIGIGLALSRSIIEGQGGHIRAENRHGGGARFVLRLYPDYGRLSTA